MVPGYCRIALSLGLILWLAAFSGCGWIGGLFGKKKPDLPPEALAQEGFKKLEKEKYEDAIVYFEKLRDRYPYSEEAILAELKVADAKYFSKKYDEALQDYKNFEKLHPTNPAIPYVIYQQGLCYYRQRSTIDRDPTFTVKALQEFRRLKQRYPEYEKVPRAEKLIDKCLAELAEHEFYIAEFYFRTGRYRSALDRFAAIEQEYPDFLKMPKVKDYIRRCEEILANPVKADPPWYAKPWHYLFDANW